MSQSHHTSRIVVLGMLVAAAPSIGPALTVARCNALSDGIYRPVLTVISDDGRENL